jgi:hypothetical protein
MAAFPVEILDQDDIWIDPQGGRHVIRALDSQEALLWALDYLLANARILREAWSKKTRQTYDTEVKARRWMLDRKVTRGLMRRIVQLDRKQIVQEAFNDLSTKQPPVDRGNAGVEDHNRTGLLRFLPTASSHTLQRGS